MMRTFLLILSFILILIGFGPFVQAQMDGPITAENAHAYATAPTAKTGAVFMTLKNAGGEDDTLVGADTDVAQINEIHENYIDPDDGTMMMRKIKSAIVPANDHVMFEPTGKHIMLINLEERLVQGHTFTLTLTFEKAGTVVVPVQIVAPGTTKPMEGHDMHGDMPMGDHTGH